ncbi:unnamed protein product [Prunus brigantina]
MILELGELIEFLDRKSEVVDPTGPIDQYGKFDCSIDHESSEIASSFKKYYNDLINLLKGCTHFKTRKL